MKKLIIILSLLMSATPAQSEGPLGVAFVQAPEQSFGVCFSGSADKGMACARKKCTANGTPKAECLRVKWCYPAGWSADIFLQHKEGHHWHQYLCGWPTERRR